jgi:hypothetical protein
MTLVSSYYLGVRDGTELWWCSHVCAPYLDEADASWFASSLPVVGYFHDRDLVINGVEWFATHLARWRDAGATRVIDFRQLAAELSCRLRVDESTSDPSLIIERVDALPLVKPLHVHIHLPEGAMPSTVRVCLDGRELRLGVDHLEDGVGHLVVPC